MAKQKPDEVVEEHTDVLVNLRIEVLRDGTIYIEPADPSNDDFGSLYFPDHATGREFIERVYWWFHE